MAFINVNYLKLSQKDIAKKTGLSVSVIKRVYRDEKLVVSKELQNIIRANKLKKYFTPEDDEFIRQNLLGNSVKKVAKTIGRCAIRTRERAYHLGLENILQENAKNSYYKKGQEPFNKGKKQVEYMAPEQIEATKKTRFKKGNLPPNTLYDFAITKRNDHNRYSYYHIRLAKSKWQLLHRYIWELYNGPIPKGHNVQFKDGNTLNCTLENLYLVDRAQQVVVNGQGGKKLPYELRETIKIINQIKKKIKTYEEQN